MNLKAFAIAYLMSLVVKARVKPEHIPVIGRIVGRDDLTQAEADTMFRSMLMIVIDVLD